MNERVFNKNIERLRNPERKERLEIDRVVDLIFTNKSIHSVLDIGTGSGLFAEAFFNKNVAVTGIDLNPEMIEASKSYLPDCKFYISKAERIPFGNKLFDIAFFGLVFHEVDDYLKALSEAQRVATLEVFILEWNYKIEELGPPIEHRINPDFIKQLANELGFKSFEIITLKHLALYKLTV